MEKFLFLIGIDVVCLLLKYILKFYKYPEGFLVGSWEYNCGIWGVVSRLTYIIRNINTPVKVRNINWKGH